MLDAKIGGPEMSNFFTPISLISMSLLKNPKIDLKYMFKSSTGMEEVKTVLN